MGKLLRLTTAIGLAYSLQISAAYAYVGPGLGLGTIGTILGIVFSVFLAIFAIAWYPMKRFLKKMRKSDVTAQAKIPDEKQEH